MKVFVLLAFIPSLITADILCPNSKTTCPDDKECCEVEGEYSCCDPDVDQDMPARRMKVYAGVEIMSFNPMAVVNAPLIINDTMQSFGMCDYSSCLGTCCDDSMFGCCPYVAANCCPDNKCCPNSSPCCAGSCCGSFNKCCGKGCCSMLQNCCGNGCCGFKQNCCGSWCCKEGYRCGPRYKTCVSRGVLISPQFVALLLTAATVFISRRL